LFVARSGVLTRFADSLACEFAAAGPGYFVSVEEFHYYPCMSLMMMRQEQHIFYFSNDILDGFVA